MFREFRYFWFSLLLIVFALSACVNKSGPAAEQNIPPMREHNATVLPPEFQGRIVVSDGKQEDVILIARKGERVRFDLNTYPEARISRLKDDQCYTVHHKARVYSVFRCMYEQETDESKRLFGDLSGEEYELFRTVALDDLTIIERINGYTTYRQGLERDFDYRIITVDDASGMKVKTEFPNWKGQMEQGSLLRYKIELRDLQFKVDDSVFLIPPDYQGTAFPKS